ncbi:unnamed protein product [Diamesa hyperborea]
MPELENNNACVESASIPIQQWHYQEPAQQQHHVKSNEWTNTYATKKPQYLHTEVIYPKDIKHNNECGSNIRKPLNNDWSTALNYEQIISTLLIVSITSVLSSQAWPGVASSGWVNNQPAEWPQQSSEWQQPNNGWPKPELITQTIGWTQPSPVWQQSEEVLIGGPNPVAWKPNTEWQQSSTVGVQTGSGSQQSGWDTGNYPARKPTITKHIYVHAPPPEKEELLPPRWIQPSPPNKHYKIIFIKTPDAQKLGPIKIPAQPQNEEKTLVYVLSKKPDSQQDIIVQPPVQTKPSKPEVYYIKYKTKSEQVKYGPSEHIPNPPKTDYGVPSH